MEEETTQKFSGIKAAIITAFIVGCLAAVAGATGVSLFARATAHPTSTSTNPPKQTAETVKRQLAECLYTFVTPGEGGDLEFGDDGVACINDIYGGQVFNEDGFYKDLYQN